MEYKWETPNSVGDRRVACGQGRCSAASRFGLGRRGHHLAIPVPRDPNYDAAASSDQNTEI